MADDGSILVTGAAGQLGAVGVTMAAVARAVGVDALVNMSWNQEEKRA